MSALPTPGSAEQHPFPWKVVRLRAHGFPAPDVPDQYLVHDAQGRLVAGSIDDRATARRIAALPDLIAAVRELLTYLPKPEPESDPLLQAELAAAITAARDAIRAKVGGAS
jgi:hypothetical protein